MYTIIQFAIILIFSLILSIQDFKTMKISNWICYASYICISACHLIFDAENFWFFVLSAALLAGFYTFTKFISKNKFGTGDILFGIFQGLCLPFYNIWLCLMVEVACSLFYAYKKRKQAFPFIPFMSAGLIFTFVLLCY